MIIEITTFKVIIPNSSKIIIIFVAVIIGYNVNYFLRPIKFVSVAITLFALPYK